MELYIYNSTMALQGVIDEITSFIWTRRYWQPGEMKLLAPWTQNHVNLLVAGNLVMRTGDSEAAEIEYVHISTGSEGYDEIEVQGRMITGWLDRRIITTQLVATATTPQALIAQLVADNLVSPMDTNRAIPSLTQASVDDLGTTAIDYASADYASVLDAVSELAEAAAIGFRITADRETGAFSFVQYAGLDRSTGQSARAPSVFSRDFDNILGQEFTDSMEDARTTAYVGGEELESTTRIVETVGGASTGLSRREVFISGSDVKQEEMTETAYRALLAQRGTEKLEEYVEALTLDCTVNPDANLVYKTDYDVGDVVTCFSRRWGLTLHARITEIEEIYQNNVRELNITFGVGELPLAEKIKRKINY